MAITTVSGGYFPNKDISHKPKRMQSEVADELSNNMTINNSMAEIHLNVPQNCTLESAISYYESHANSEYARLYKRTAQWLKDLLKSKQTLKEAAKHTASTASAPVLNSAT